MTTGGSWRAKYTYAHQPEEHGGHREFYEGPIPQDAGGGAAILTTLELSWLFATRAPTFHATRPSSLRGSRMYVATTPNG